MGWEAYESRISLTKGPAIRSCEYRVVGTAFGGGPHGATTLARGAPKWGGAAMATPATRAFDGAPYGATILVRGVPKWGGAAM